MIDDLQFVNPEGEVIKFDPDQEYTPKMLEAFATSALKKDRKHLKNGGISILFDDQLYKFSKREVCVDSSQIDGTLTNMMQDPNRPGIHTGDGHKIFNRTHPLGRPTNDKEARKERGESFYKN